MFFLVGSSSALNNGGKKIYTWVYFLVIIYGLKRQNEIGGAFEILDWEHQSPNKQLGFSIKGSLQI